MLALLTSAALLALLHRVFVYRLDERLSQAFIFHCSKADTQSCRGVVYTDVFTCLTPLNVMLTLAVSCQEPDSGSACSGLSSVDTETGIVAH